MTGDGGGASADRQVEVTRVFDAPQELVFRAWLDPVQIASWWAPAGLSVPAETIEVEAREGGRINFSMVDPESGREYPVRFEIVELVEPELLVMESPPAREVGIPARVVTRVVFEEDGSGTRVTVTQGPHTAELHPQAQAGWTSILEKLETLLAS